MNKYYLTYFCYLFNFAIYEIYLSAIFGSNVLVICSFVCLLLFLISQLFIDDQPSGHVLHKMSMVLCLVSSSETISLNGPVYAISNALCCVDLPKTVAIRRIQAAIRRFNYEGKCFQSAYLMHCTWLYTALIEINSHVLRPGFVIGRYAS